MFRRKTTTPRQPADPKAVAAGMRAFAAGLDGGDLYAIEALSPLGELPHSPDEWAAYPETRQWLRQEHGI